MASTSRIATLLVVEIKDRARPIFKKYPIMSIKDDPKGYFSSIPYATLHNEDIRAYIHCDIEDLGNVDMLSLYSKHLVEILGNLKLEYQNLQGKGFAEFIHFLIFDELEWI